MLVDDYTPHLADDSFVIFLLHGVIRKQPGRVRNYTRKHILSDRFSRILRGLLAAGGRPTSLPEIAEATLEGRALSPRSFAITFDDGFENNATVAAPVLEELAIPATFYLTTQFVQDNGASWIDRIEYAVERTPTVRLRLEGAGIDGSFATAEEKIALLDRIRAYVKGDSTVDPYAFAQSVWQQLGVTEMQPDPELDQKMSWEQARSLARNPLFEIGGHSHSHRILEFLPQAELEDEIRTSLGLLRSKVSPDVRHYSYPEGLSHCYSDRVIAALRDSGVVCSVAAEPGVNAMGTDLFRLKRTWVL